MVSATEKTPLTDDELAAIEARANASLDGPWAFEVYQMPPGTKRPDGVGPSGKIHSDGFPIAAMVDETEGQFMAHARTDVPRLLAALRKARRALREAAEHIDSGALLIESEIGDCDGECAEEREFAASLRALAGGAK